MDRSMRLLVIQALIERLRLYPQDAMNAMFARLDDIEREHGLIPAFTADEEAVIAAYEAKIERGEYVRELDIAVTAPPIEDFLPETEETILSRLSALPEDEREKIFTILSQLIDIDAPQLGLSLAQVADLRHTLKKSEQSGETSSVSLDEFRAQLNAKYGRDQ